MGVRCRIYGGRFRTWGVDSRSFGSTFYWFKGSLLAGERFQFSGECVALSHQIVYLIAQAVQFVEHVEDRLCFHTSDDVRGTSHKTLLVASIFHGDGDGLLHAVLVGQHDDEPAVAVGHAAWVLAGFLLVVRRTDDTADFYLDVGHWRGLSFAVLAAVHNSSLDAVGQGQCELDVIQKVQTTLDVLAVEQLEFSGTHFEPAIFKQVEGRILVISNEYAQVLTASFGDGSLQTCLQDLAQVLGVDVLIL